MSAAGDALRVMDGAVNVRKARKPLGAVVSGGGARGRIGTSCDAAARRRRQASESVGAGLRRCAARAPFGVAPAEGAVFHVDFRFDRNGSAIVFYQPS